MTSDLPFCPAQMLAVEASYVSCLVSRFVSGLGGNSDRDRKPCSPSGAERPQLRIAILLALPLPRSMGREKPDSAGTWQRPSRKRQRSRCQQIPTSTAAVVAGLAVDAAVVLEIIPGVILAIIAEASLSIVTRSVVIRRGVLVLLFHAEDIVQGGEFIQEAVYGDRLSTEAEGL